MDTIKKDIDRLYDAVERLRQHTDNDLAELRASLDAQRKEASASMRWMVG